MKIDSILSSLASLTTDVNISSVANQNVLQYDSGTGKWVNVTPATLAGTMSLASLGTRSIANLSDVSISGVATNNFITYNGASWSNVTASGAASVLPHSSLSGLTTTDAGHTQFALLTGRSGGQTLVGGTAASNNLILQSTSNGTKGQVQLGSTLYVDEVNSRVGIGNSSPGNPLSINPPTTTDSLARFLVSTGSTTNKGIVIQAVASQSANLFETQSSGGTVLTRITSGGDLRVIDASDAVSNIYLGGTGNNYGFQRSYNDMYYNAGIHHFKVFGGATAYLEIQSPANDTIAAQCCLPTVQYSSVGFGAYGDSGFIGAQFAGGVLSTGAGATRRRTFGLHGSLVVTSNANYTSRLTINVSDYNNEKPGREGLRIESDGTQALIGAFGATAVARQTVTGSRGGNAALASLITALANLGFITDSTS